MRVWNSGEERVGEKRLALWVSCGAPETGVSLSHRRQMASSIIWPMKAAIHVRVNWKFLRKRVAKILDELIE